MTNIMILGGPLRDGKCRDIHGDYECTKEYGHNADHGTWRLGIGNIDWKD
jgi:hypothetical protein